VCIDNKLLERSGSISFRRFQPIFETANPAGVLPKSYSRIEPLRVAPALVLPEAARDLLIVKRWPNR